MDDCEHPSLEIITDAEQQRSFVRCQKCQAELLDFGAAERRAYRAGGSRRRRPGTDSIGWTGPPIDQRSTLRPGYGAGQRALERALELEGQSPPYRDLPARLVCPSCERNPIARNGRCEECQWAVN